MLKGNPLLIINRLKKVFTARGAMDLGDPYKTLVGVILSARTRDEQVLLVLPRFFKTFPTIEILARASISDIQKHIATIGMNGQKAKHLKVMAIRVCNVYDGNIPNTMDTLITLAGVGRKTASVVLSVAFHVPAIAVDVHVHRVAGRLGWSHAKNPQGTERDLLTLIPQNAHSIVNRVFVKLGRYICLPKKPRCVICPLQDICPYKKKVLTTTKSKQALIKVWKEKEKNLSHLRQQVIQVK